MFKNIIDLMADWLGYEKRHEITLNDHYGEYGANGIKTTFSRLEEVEKQMKEKFPNAKFVSYKLNRVEEFIEIEIWCEEDDIKVLFSCDLTNIEEKEIISSNGYKVGTNGLKKLNLEYFPEKVQEEIKSWNQCFFKSVQELNEYRLYFVTKEIKIY